MIAYEAEKLTKAQYNYTPMKDELCTAIAFIRPLKYYLMHRAFILRTYHQALKYTRTMEQPAGMEEKWLQKLVSYKSTV